MSPEVWSFRAVKSKGTMKMSSILRQAGQKFNMNGTQQHQSSGLEVIDPATASQMLETGYGIDNRRISAATVERYARDMSEGRWIVTGEAIKFDAAGRLVDGQHRLYAVVQSGTTIQSFVIRGVDHAAFAVMDSGKRRNASDFLSIHGYPNTHLLAATVVKFLGFHTYGDFRTVRMQDYPNNNLILETLHKYPEIETGLRIGRNPSLRAIAGSGSLFGALWVLFSHVDEDDANAFFAALAEGASMEPDDPILILRNSLIRMKSETRGQPDQNYIGALVIKAWNAWRRGQPVKLLRFKPGGAQRETYPVIQ